MPTCATTAWAASGRSVSSRGIERTREHVDRLGGTRRVHCARPFHAVLERLERPAAAGDEHELGRGKQVVEGTEDRLDLRRGQEPDVTEHHDPVLGHERWCRHAVEHRVDDCLPGVGATALAFRRAAAGDLVLLEREGRIVAGQQLADEQRERLDAEDGVVAFHEVNGHGVAPAASSASIVRQTRMVPATSWTRTMRQPCMTP